MKQLVNLVSDTGPYSSPVNKEPPSLKNLKQMIPPPERPRMTWVPSKAAGSPLMGETAEICTHQNRKKMFSDNCLFKCVLMTEGCRWPWRLSLFIQDQGFCVVGVILPFVEYRCHQRGTH